MVHNFGEVNLLSTKKEGLNREEEEEKADHVGQRRYYMNCPWKKIPLGFYEIGRVIGVSKIC